MISSISLPDIKKDGEGQEWLGVKMEEEKKPMEAVESSQLTHETKSEITKMEIDDSAPSDSLVNGVGRDLKPLVSGPENKRGVKEELEPVVIKADTAARLSSSSEHCSPNEERARAHTTARATSNISKLENTQNPVPPPAFPSTSPTQDHDFGPSENSTVSSITKENATTAIKWEPVDVILNQDSPSISEQPSLKRHRMLIDAVVLPKLASVWIERKNNNRKIEQYRNPAVKKPKEIRFNLDTVRERLELIGLDLFPIDLEQEVLDVTMRRDFIAQHYGGNHQARFISGFLVIPANNLVLKLGKSHFLYPSLENNPECPERPGAPGLLFNVYYPVRNLDDEGAEDLQEGPGVGYEAPNRTGRYTLIVRLGPPYLVLSRRVRNRTSSTTNEPRMDAAKTQGRQPTKKEAKAAAETEAAAEEAAKSAAKARGEKYIPTVATPEEIGGALARGEMIVAVSTLNGILSQEAILCHSKTRGETGSWIDEFEEQDENPVEICVEWQEAEVGR
ncbi:hypothetical protein B0H17DRAFT_1251998 [Mycena rosella]|uniref:DUF6697 domain-containing protein n=1 Tax=Mycena rosella TaxID=1033263 RepID=A0AAD7CW39_MYCRO|nr:hypothetical protein B0H17DRAFT_1251998 [Mycena rosella]